MQPAAATPAGAQPEDEGGQGEIVVVEEPSTHAVEEDERVSKKPASKKGGKTVKKNPSGKRKTNVEGAAALLSEEKNLRTASVGESGLDAEPMDQKMGALPSAFHRQALQRPKDRRMHQGRALP